jgi:hypothetical protein
MTLQRKIGRIICTEKNMLSLSVFVMAVAGPSGFAASAQFASKSGAGGGSSSLVIKEWFAFGSGCKASSKAGNTNLKIQRGTASSIKAQLGLDDFVLSVPAGGSGVRECAVRLTVEPQLGYRIKDLGVKAQIQAKKIDSVQLRSRVLLLLGERLLARQEWNIPPMEFARHRNQDLYLVPGSQADMTMPQTPCGKAQIVGLDFTFEGLTHANKVGSEPAKEDSFLRVVPGTQTELEIFFEKCR